MFGLYFSCNWYWTRILDEFSWLRSSLLLLFSAILNNHLLLHRSFILFLGFSNLISYRSALMENPTSFSIPKIPTNQLMSMLTLKLTDSYFITWKSLMLPVIRKFKIMKFLDRSHECPVQFTNRTNANNGVENPLYTYWVDEDSAIIMWINSKISDMLIYYFANASTPYELWKAISDRFACISSTHSIQLRTKLLTIKKGNSFIVANTIEIKMITNELAACGYIISDMKLWYSH